MKTGTKKIVALGLILFACSVVAAIADNECTRGDAEPIIKKHNKGIKSYRQTRKGPRTMVEEAVLKNGVLLLVEQGGCAHFWVKYTFILPDKNRGVQDTAYWLRRAAEHLGSARSLLEFNTQKIQQAIKRASRKPYRYGNEIVLTEGYEHVYVDVQLLPKGLVKIVVSQDIAL